MQVLETKPGSIESLTTYLNFNMARHWNVSLNKETIVVKERLVLSVSVRLRREFRYAP